MSNLQSLEQRMDRVDYQVISDDKDEQIADLEAKLAEYEKFMKDNDFKNLKELDHYIQKIHSHYDEVKNNGTCGLCEKLDNELINQLKQQLAEKEINITNEEFEKEVEKTYQKINQDKILFCIEKLKSIKNELSNLIVLRTDETFLIDGKKFRDYINNEIELTKKENKNV